MADSRPIGKLINGGFPTVYDGGGTLVFVLNRTLRRADCEKGEVDEGAIDRALLEGEPLDTDEPERVPRSISSLYCWRRSTVGGTGRRSRARLR